MHALSNDFISDCLKKREHWNSFNTSFFLSVETILAKLGTTGMLGDIDEAKMYSLLKLPLKCSFCSLNFTSMPSFKAHIYEHRAK